MNELYHSGIKGMTWSNHKYIRKIGNRYIYDAGSSAMGAGRSAVDAYRYRKAAKNTKGLRRYRNNRKSARAMEIARENWARSRRSAKGARTMYGINAKLRGKEALDKGKKAAGYAKRFASNAADKAGDYAREFEKDTRNARRRVKQAALTGYYLTEPARNKAKTAVTGSKAYKTAKRSASNAYNKVRTAQTKAADTEFHNRLVRQRKKRSAR